LFVGERIGDYTGDYTGGCESVRVHIKAVLSAALVGVYTL